MISVDEARQIIQQHTPHGNLITLDLDHATGYAVAHDIFATIAFPSFRQSAMDGYALRFDDLSAFTTLQVTHEIQAGQTESINHLDPGATVRIFTGARVPDDADTVVMQEQVERDGNHIRIRNTDLTRSANIRPIGSQTRKGECVLEKGSPLNAATAALLAGLGITTIDVLQQPRCSILTTGRELVQPGLPLAEGQIYESNSFALQAALRPVQSGPVPTQWVDDDLAQTREAIARALATHDILLITGGVSVGEYDFVSTALQQLGVQQLFHKVKQKPGKPLYFGKKDNTLVFGLPGNPGSVLTCFYEYVLPCIRSYMGFARPALLTLSLPLCDSYHKKSGLTHFLKGKITPAGVALPAHQESYKMNAFALADCLVVVPEDSTGLDAGDPAEIHLLNCY